MKRVIVGLLFVHVCLCAGVSEACGSLREPILLIPGMLASQIKAKLNKETVPHFYCEKQSDDYQLWIEFSALTPKEQECWLDNVVLQYNNVTKEYSDAPGVSSYLLPGLEGIKCVDPSVCKASPVYEYMIKYFVECGYTENVDLFGISYDWRAGIDAFGKDGHFSFYQSLKQQIESIKASTGMKAHIVSISMGAPVMLHFFHTYVTQEWKDEFINSWISLSGVICGTAFPLLVDISGITGYFPFMDPTIFRDAGRTMGGLTWMTPPLNEHWKDIPLVNMPDRNYTAADIGDLFPTLPGNNVDILINVWNDAKDIIPSICDAPGVPVHALYGVNLTTPLTMVFADYNFENQPTEIIETDGDDTVPTASVQWTLTNWVRDQGAKYPVEEIPVPNMQHKDPLYKEPYWDIILGVTTHN